MVVFLADVKCVESDAIDGAVVHLLPRQSELIWEVRLGIYLRLFE